MAVKDFILLVPLACTGFDLTFQKRFVSFTSKNNHRTDLNCMPNIVWCQRKFCTKDRLNDLKELFFFFFLLFIWVLNQKADKKRTVLKKALIKKEPLGTIHKVCTL